MAKFYVYETMLCEVTFIREVDEALDENMALADLPGEQVGVVIGDASNLDDGPRYEVLPARSENLPYNLYRAD